MANHTSVKRWIVGAALAVLFLALPGSALFGMGQGGQKPPEQERTAPPSAVSESRTPIRDILNDPVKFSDAEVTLEGVFRGWKGACPSSVMMSRSDWIIEDQTGCIYITGLVPNDLSPAQPQGEHIVVTGRVIVGKMGKPVIKAARIIRIPDK